MVNVAIIPARGGSKRIPGKNIKLFHGKPIIAYSIEAALASGLFDQVVVSTDDEEIAGIAMQYGATAPFIRPKNLSDDYSGTHAVLDHAIKWLQDQGQKIDYACCIYATAPLLSVDYLKQAYQRMVSEQKSFIFSVTQFPFPIQRALFLNEENVDQPEPFDRTAYKTRSQDLRACYHDAGQFYWGTPLAFEADYELFSENTAVICLPRNEVCDIDEMTDWDIAENLYLNLKRKDAVCT
jgi:pseudaminic acid cytidylyltransferase